VTLLNPPIFFYNKRMRTTIILLLCCLILLGAAGSSPSTAEAVGWQTLIQDSIWYREYQLSNPFNRAYVARMKRDVAGVTLESTLGQGKISSGTETVKGQFQRYDGSLNYWDWNGSGVSIDLDNWGARSQAVVAINGSYFNADGSPQSGQVIANWYAKRFLELQNYSGIVWKNNRELFVGGCITHPANKQLVTFSDSSTLEIDDINATRGANSLVLFTPQFESRTPEMPAEATIVDVVLEMSRPALITLQSANANGVVREIRQNQGVLLEGTPILFDRVVLSASGSLATELAARVHVGDTVGLAQKLNDYHPACAQQTDKSWEGAYTVIQNDFHFLKKGEIVVDADNPNAMKRAPRTAIVFNNVYVYFVVVDGRNPGISYGMTIQELAEFALTLDEPTNGLMEGAALDGGGSSTMVVNGVVKNFPSDGVQNPYADDQPPQRIFVPLVHGGVAEPQPESLPLVERPVANGMMMVVVKAPKFSQAFQVGQEVKTTANINLRQGPGTNQNSLAIIPKDTSGQIVAHANGLNGVSATGHTWWFVQFGSQVGWAAESFLANP
jgi:hypothetical protein